ncbi:MAG: FAD-dependent oxidoreductase [Armatimonadota bacterium]|nr:MAG: FAD-dependent oxidoreductase [Armatimonadota bacterium]
MSEHDWDVIIVGAGPAGVFCALELAKKSDVRVLMLEKGEDLDTRIARRNSHSREHGEACSITTGWGGAGAFSDGKLTMSPLVGGQLANFVSPDHLTSLLDEVEQTYVHFGAPERVYGADDDALGDIARKATLADLEFVPTRVRHMGTDRCLEVLQHMRTHVEQSAEVRTCAEVTEILTYEGIACGVRLADGQIIQGKYVVVAPGREGAEWFQHQADQLQLERADNPVDIGVRVELPAAVMEPLTSVVYEPKLLFNSKEFDDRVRTFCVCPYGEVVIEHSDATITVNGHSYAGKRTENTNFALLVTTRFTEPFREPIAYGRYVARLANLLSGGIIVQRLGDLTSGRRSTQERIARGMVRPTLAEATPGDLSFALPYRYLASILEMIEALDHMTPGVASRHTLLYGVEVKFYSARVRLTPALETQVNNLFAIGDGAGVTRGLVQASASGMIAAREIMPREGEQAP